MTLGESTKQSKSQGKNIVVIGNRTIPTDAFTDNSEVIKSQLFAIEVLKYWELEQASQMCKDLRGVA